MNTTIESLSWLSQVATGSNTQLNQIGKIALWLGVLENAFSTAGFSFLAQKAQKETLMFYYINILICSLSTYCYLLMVMRQGDYITSDDYLVFWPRYLEFTLGTPLLLIDLGLVAGADPAELVFIIMCDILMMWSGWSATIATNETTKCGVFNVQLVRLLPSLPQTCVSVVIVRSLPTSMMT